MSLSQKINQSIMAFDFGEKRIGVAMKQQGTREPRPLVTIDGTIDIMSQLKHLIRTHQPDLLVVGRPRGLDGQTTAQTKKSELFAAQLRAKTGVAVVLQDETLSSVEAERRLPKKTNLKTRKALLDQIAAQIILEDFLNEQ